MKKILFFWMMLVALIPAALQAQETITIGDGTSAYYMPLPGWYGWQYEVLVYTPDAAEALDGNFELTQIAFNVQSNSTTSGAQMTIWVKDVDADFALASSQTFAELITDATQVYTNTAFTSTSGWNTYELSETFTHQAGNALLVAVRGIGCGTSGGCSRQCYYTEAANMHWHKRQDSSDPGTSASGTVDNKRSNIQLTIQPVGGVTCPKPTSLTVSDVTADQATLTWTDEAATGNYTLQYKTASQDWEDDEVITEYTSGTEINLSGLTQNTTYNVRLASVCVDENSSWRSASFTTTLVAAEIPFICDFEDDDINTYWAIENGAQTNKWHIGTAVNNTLDGEKSLYISNDNGVSNAYTISSAASSVWAYYDVLFTEYSGFLLSFDWKSGGESSSDYMKVFVGDPVQVSAGSNSTPAGAVQIGQYNLKTTWQHAEVLLSSTYSNTTKRIYFLWRNDGSVGTQPPVAIDNVSLVGTNCGRPDSLHVDNVGTNTADLSWISQDSEFNVYVKAYGDTVFTLADISPVYDTFCTISNLNAGSSYQVYVAAVCDENEIASATVTFSTECEAISEVPRTWGFEAPNIAGTTSYPLPACWSRIGNTNFPYSYSYSSYAHDGTYSLYTSSNPTNYIAILPQINTDELNLNDLQLRFFARMSAAAVTKACIEVGVMTDPTDASSFVVVDSVSKNTANALTATYKGFEVPFTDYEERGAYIALRFNASYSSSYSYAYIYVDDVTLEYIPLCTRPDSLHMTSIEVHSADVNWVSDGTDFNIYYKAPNATEYTLANESPVSESPYTITGLEAATNYQVMVANVCSDGSEILANDATSFTTLCDVYVAPYTENFTGFNTAMSPCWDRYTGLASEVFNGDTLTASTSGWVFSSSDVFPLGHPKVNVYGTSCKYWLVTPSLDLSQLTEPALMFNLALSDYNNADPIEDPTAQEDDKFMVIVSTDNGNTWSAANATVWNNTGDGDYVYNTIATVGDDVVIPLSQYADSIIRIAFYVESTASGGDNDLHIANVSVNEMPACSRPNGLALASVSASEATITWNGEEDGLYQVAFDTTGFNIDGEDVTVVDANENSVVLEDLLASTAYDVYVRSICGSGYSAWSNVLTFRTACEIAEVTEDEPFTENFNTLTTGIPACWDNSEGTTTTESYKWNYYATGETGACVRFNSYSNSNGNTNMLKTPVLDLSGLSTPMLSFSYKNPTGGDFSVYLSTDGGVTYPTVIATGLTGATNWTEAEYILSDLENAETVVIVFKGTSNWGSGQAYIDLDNVFVGESSGCLTPANVAVAYLSSDEATITWNNVLEGTTLELYYKEHSQSDYTTVYASEFIDENSYLMTDLTPSTTYDVYVAALCDEDTLASSVLSFTTTCVSVVVTEDIPFTEDFNTLTTGIPACWDNSEGTTTTESYKWNYYASGETGACVRFNSFFNSNGNTNMLKTPVLDLSALSTPMVSFSYKNPTGGDFSVYLSTDGGTTYPTVIATGLTGASDWTEAEYVLSDLENTETVVVVFKGTSNYGSGQAYIDLDNVFVGEAPTCPKPTGLTVTTVTDNSVSLSWTAGGDEPTWEIVYGTPGFDMEDGTVISNVSTNPYEVTGLSNTTNYEFYVRANCGGGDYSYWSNNVTASTNMVAVDLPYSTDFSNQDWKLNNGTCTNKWRIGVPADSTNAALYITEDNNSTNYNATSTSVVSAEKLFNMTNADSVNIVFDVRSGGEAGADYIKVFFAPSDVQFEPSTSAPTSGDYAYYSYSNNAVNFQDYLSQTTGSSSTGYEYKLNLTQGRLHIDVNMPNPAPNGQAKLVFVWKNDYSIAHQPGAIIENVSVGDATDTVGPGPQPIECNAPTNVTASNVTHNSADIDWTQDGTPDSWTISYKKGSVETWTTVNVTSHPYTITDLESETSYSVKVTANCGENSQTSSTIPFVTLPNGVNEYVNSTVLYPNPTTGQFTILNEQCTIENVEVYDVYGKVLNSVVVNDNKAVLDVAGYASGIYFARIHTDKGVVVKQIVKK